ncbi:Tigger transposable element-derived protein 1-like 106, partial [Homarus americanus]
IPSLKLPIKSFNCDETGLFWKKSPKATFISKKEKQAKGVKMAKDRFSVLLTCNASGDCLMKPLVIYKYKRPRAYKGCDMSKLNEIAETVSSSEEEEGPPLAASAAPPDSLTPSASTAPPDSLTPSAAPPGSLTPSAAPPGSLTASAAPPGSLTASASAAPPDSLTPSAAPLDSLTPSAAPSGSLTASASTPPPGVPSTSTMTAVNFFVKAWGNTTKATVRHAWSALLPQLKSAERKRQQPAELLNQVLETVRSIPAPGFQEVTREDLEEMMQEGNTNDIEDLLEDEEGGESGDAASNAGEAEQRKVTTQKLSLLLGVFTSLQEMIQDIESESGEREHVIGVIESISRKYQTQYNAFFSNAGQSRKTNRERLKLMKTLMTLGKCLKILTLRGLMKC